nr:MAG TPA: MITOTIC SPINDLE ASSEMBLY CHECKPOINT PROTEIN SPINDLE CHECKPOINT, CELL CYCLE.05A [Caudoviricetes sp.]
MSKYIQSFYQYPVTFSSIGKTVPARLAQGDMRNITEVSDAELEKLQNSEPLFRELVNGKKYRVLNKIPASYVPASEQINTAKSEADRLRAENEALKARLAEIEKSEEQNEAGDESPEKDWNAMEYKELQEAAKAKGINPAQKKTALIEELEKAE